MPHHEFTLRSLRALCASFLHQRSSILKRSTGVVILACATLLAGCGQKGDLRPSQPKPPVQSAVYAMQATSHI